MLKLSERLVVLFLMRWTCVDTRLLSKCHDTNSQLEKMATALNDASVRLQNVNNQFMALSSSQFIESRVYDDDDVVTTDPAVKESPPPSVTDELSSLKRGVWALEGAHEALAILHDSDTDTDSADEMPARLVLKPRDMYADRPLPYIIGSQPWKNKWHAGLLLEDSDSDSSTSKVAPDSEQYSHSEREDSPSRVHVADTHTTISEASSELPSEPGSLPKPSPADVATEIARRLGGKEPAKVDQEPVYEEPAKPTIKKLYRPQDPVVSTVFPESPPPLSRSASGDSTSSDIFADLHRPAYSKPQDNDLFHFRDDEPDDEGDIFSDFAKPSSDQVKPTSLFDAGPTPNMFKSERQPEAANQNTETQAEKGVKKPVGGISLFGKNDTESIGAAILKRNQRKPSTSGEESGSDFKTEGTQPSEKNKTEKDIFDDLFARSEPKKIAKDKINIVKDVQKEIVKKNEMKKVKNDNVGKEKIDLFNDNLFDDIDDIFTTNVVKMPTNNTKSIFDDDDDLFAEIAAPKVIKNEASSSNKKREALFDSEDELFSENVSKNVEKPVKTEKSIVKENSKLREPNNSLFDENDDLFNDVKSTNQLRDTKIMTIHDTKVVNTEYEIKKDKATTFKSTSLFGDDDEDDDHIFSETKVKSTVKIHDDENKKSNSDEVKNKIDNKINNNTINESVTKNPNLVENLVNNTNLPKTTEESPFKISGLLNKMMEASSSDDDLSDENFGDQSESPKDDKIQNINQQSIFDNDLDIDMFKERNNVEKGKDMSENLKGEKIVKDPYKNAIESAAKDNVKDATKDNLKDIKTTTPKDILKDTKATTAKDDIINATENLGKDNIRDMKANTATEALKNITEKDLLKDTTSSVEDIKGTTEKDNLKGEKEINDTKENLDDFTFNDILNIAQKDIKDSEPIEDGIFKKPKTQTGNNEIIPTSVTANIFSEILSEPPIFEKPKEPKKSKNVNALFDDDSDDESLFFKKDDVISDEKPPDFKPAQDRLFGIFTDEPPDDDFKAGHLDDDIFSTLPKPKIPQQNLPNSTTVKNVETTIPNNNFNIGDVLLNLPETTIEPPKLPISTSEVPENKIPIHEKLDSTIENLGTVLLDTDEKIDSVSEANLFESKKDKIPFQKGNPVEDMIKDTDDIFQDKSKIIVKKELKPEDLKSEEKDLTEKSEPKKVGKLKVGLNINVNALLPGASPKKTKINDQTDGQAQSQTQNLDKKVEKQDLDLPRSVSFDGNPDSEVLDNKLSKERPRIQVKRRPSTRRARKEAVRKSGIDFGDDSTDNSSSIDDAPKHTKNQPEIPKSENLDQIDGKNSESSNQIEDLDNKPIQTETQAEIQVETPKQDEIKPTYSRDIKSKVVYILNDEDIFDSPVEKSDPNPDKSENINSNVDLNPGVSTLGQVYDKTDKTEPKSSLFDDDDDDDEMFKGKTVKKQTIFDSDSDEELFGSKKEKVKVKEVKKDIKVKGNLFGDEDDDDDDLFGVKTKKVVEIKPQSSRSTVKETPKSSAPVFEDPLSMFGDDD
ncbi:WASH complex subunit 2C isoform X2 [Trichoplusia ni]|uniref:WASH complex subunit 2C isoform X2 n=1 Tax=Trichoplusia ni TaxID=7111 RepID=A0A7E5WG16_TRINI|nr:WASH complex subunit 2C isoform X2 [Trichoplusia ni]